LQTFQALIIHLQAARNRFAYDRDEALQTLDSALDLGGAAIVEGREAIQAMRSSTEGMNDLAQALQALGHELTSERSVEFQVVLEGSSREIHPDSAREVYRIAREAIRNAFRHADATKIEANITYGKSLRVRIRDNGKGIDPGVERRTPRPLRHRRNARARPAPRGRVGHLGRSRGGDGD
jgi:signal transduction histidine kinase